MMLRRIARPMLAAWFVTEGVAGFRGAPHHLEPTRTGVDALAERVEMTRPTDEQIRTIVKVHGAATAGAGLALALGKAPRLAALVLAALTLPAAVVNLVASRKETAKAERREHALRALSFTGAALIAAADREGRPGLAWKVAHVRKLAAASAGAGVLGARHTGEKAAKAVKVAAVTEAKGAAKAGKAVKAAAVTPAKGAATAASRATGKGAGALSAVLGAKAAKAAKAATSASETSRPSRSDRPSRSEARAAKAAARTESKAAAAAEKQGAKVQKAVKVASRADAKAAKVAEKDAARAAKAAAAAEAEALKATKTAQKADAKAAKRLRRSAGSVVTPG